MPLSTALTWVIKTLLKTKFIPKKCSYKFNFDSESEAGAASFGTAPAPAQKKDGSATVFLSADIGWLWFDPVSGLSALPDQHGGGSGQPRAGDCG